MMRTTLLAGLLVNFLAACGGGSGAPPAEFLAMLRTFPKAEKYMVVYGDIRKLKDIKNSPLDPKVMSQYGYGTRRTQLFNPHDFKHMWFYKNLTQSNLIVYLTGTWDPAEVQKNMEGAKIKKTEYKGIVVMRDPRSRKRNWAFCKDHICVSGDPEAHIDNHGKPAKDGIDPDQDPLKTLLTHYEQSDIALIMVGRGSIPGSHASLLLANVSGKDRLRAKIIAIFDTSEAAEKAHEKAKKQLAEGKMPDGKKLTDMRVDGRMLIMEFEGLTKL